MKTFPLAFIDRMYADLGEEADDFFIALDQPASISIRLHHRKGKSGFDLHDKVPWCDTGYYLDFRPAFHLDPHWHAGAYYVQEASSMILDYIIRQLHLDNRPRIWADLCAAPGGKTGILVKHMQDTDVLIANEVVSQRRSILRENLIKAGFINTFLTGEPASSFDTPMVDIMLIDAPCAGEGMMRKDQEAIDQWNEGLVQSCSRLQQVIVLEAAHGIKPGGYLIYSTCSYSMEENILNVARFAERFGFKSVHLSFPTDFNVTPIHHHQVSGCQLYPHKVRGEGLFIAVLQRTTEPGPPFTKHRKLIPFFQPVPSWLASHLKEPELLMVRKNSPGHELIRAAAEPLAREVLDLIPKAELIVQAGELKAKDFIPSHALAMSGFAGKQFQMLELDKDAALDYLERQTKSLPAVAETGWYQVLYDGSVLGWAKSTRQGWKNHYPMAWRLRKRG